MYKNTFAFIWSNTHTVKQEVCENWAVFQFLSICSQKLLSFCPPSHDSASSMRSYFLQPTYWTAINVNKTQRLKMNWSEKKEGARRETGLTRLTRTSESHWEMTGRESVGQSSINISVWSILQCNIPSVSLGNRSLHATLICVIRFELVSPPFFLTPSSLHAAPPVSLSLIIYPLFSSSFITSVHS